MWRRDNFDSEIELWLSAAKTALEAKDLSHMPADFKGNAIAEYEELAKTRDVIALRDSVLVRLVSVFTCEDSLKRLLKAGQEKFQLSERDFVSIILDATQETLSSDVIDTESEARVVDHILELHYASLMGGGQFQSEKLRVAFSDEATIDRLSELLANSEWPY